MPQITFNGVTFNFVTVTGTMMTLFSTTVTPCAGVIMFKASDLAWDPAMGMVGYMPVVGATLNVNGQFSAGLLAMDNANVSTSWAWLLTGTINGYPIPARKLTVNYANGDSQDISTLLGTSTLV